MLGGRFSNAPPSPIRKPLCSIILPMLTPTDIHLMVGVFSKLTTPENVDIILGDMVHDIASKTKRDIDITISYKNDLGEEISFVGLQVKDHNRKLGSPEVEQLILHFKDSDSIKKGGIVSASGFTKPAINKAKHHDIDLYEFRDWEHLSNDLPHIQFPESFNFNEESNSFITNPDVQYIIDEELSEVEIADFTGEANVMNLDGTQIPKTKNINDLNNNFINQALQNEIIKLQLEKAKSEEETPINVTLNVETPPVVILNGRSVPLKLLNIRGVMKKHIKSTKAQFKILVKLDDPGYQVGAAITVMSNGSLLGLSTSLNDKSIKLIVIAIADRLLKKIHQIKIK